MDVLDRVLWDEYKNNCKYDIYSESRKYLNRFAVVSRWLRLQYYLPCILSQYAISSKKVCHVTVLQDAYFDQWIKCISIYSYEKVLILPEGRFGYSTYRSLNLTNEAHALSSLATSNILKDSAISSIQQRLSGHYSSSSLAFYMSEYDLTNNIAALTPSIDNAKLNLILFLHCHNDSANIDYEPCRTSQYIDYFDFETHLLSFCANNPEISLIIRPHPSASATRWRRDEENAMNELKTLASSIPNVQIDQSRSSVKDFLSSQPPDTLAISGKGSVAIECALFGVPCLNFYKNLFTELGISTYLESLSMLLQLRQNLLKPQDLDNARSMAIAYEAFVVHRQSVGHFFDMKAQSPPVEPLSKPPELFQVY